MLRKIRVQVDGFFIYVWQEDLMNKFFTNRYQQLRAGWKIVSVFLLYFMLVMVLRLLALQALPRETASEVALYLGPVAMIVAVWIGLKLLDEQPLTAIGVISPKSGFRDLASGFGLGAVLMSLIFAILLISDQVTLANDLSAPVISHFLWRGLLLYIIVGIAEEAFFRGYCMNALQQMGMTRMTVIVSALLFAIVHGSNANVSVFGLINIFIVGLLFAFMFIKTGNLWMPIGFHIAWNYFQGNIFGFPVSGTTPHGIYNIESVKGALWTGGAFGPEGGLLATLLLGIGFFIVWWYPVKLHAKVRVFYKS